MISVNSRNSHKNKAIIEMSSLKTALSKRFGAHRVSDYPISDEDYIDLLKLELETKFPLTVLMTNGMSNYTMPVNEHYKGKEHNEIYFCLPSYWDLEDPNMRWPLELMQRLAKNVIENKTWYGAGHTIANGNPAMPLSDTVQQEYLLLTDPIALEDYLQPLQLADKTVHFLAIVPVFYDEYECKVYKGYPKWIRRYRSRNYTEIVDEHRQSLHKKRWFF